MNEPRYTGKATDFYLASGSIAEIVNLAIDLKRPILVEGEPGCGKTMLAYSIAAEKKLGEVVKISVKSTSRAQDLLYRMNALRRLQDTQNPNNLQARYVHPYLSLGPLGAAINGRKRCVVLIDEVDKADIDFPNDLLDVLDRFTFQIDDLPEEEEQQCLRERGFGRTIEGNRDAPPVVVITSNREKRLPEPFLRRCLYVRVKFPESAVELLDIVRKNTGLAPEELSDAVLVAAVDAFLRVRRLAVGNTQKPPSTSELIDWVQILHWNGETPESLNQDPNRPPHWGVLFKTMADLDSYESLSRTPAKPG
ncbi:MAG TPA: MoxR family ATPase [Accumulibacter sp.]|uniref:AAA family ATPase n=1 Tax=Accumulibacter sp. TaxID=2053492 RepID=UPI002B534D70|nr:MoxR family ATPase [Accumulibacter sp.]HRD88867.1 MoxR family ATPase [Accumulibacter sp.]